MASCIFFCTAILLQMYSASRKRLLSFELELDLVRSQN
jgi:hypothetical protein